MTLLAERTVVVTGAAQGIGLAIAKTCAEQGGRVLLADINGDAAAAAGICDRRRGAVAGLQAGEDVKISRW